MTVAYSWTMASQTSRTIRLMVLWGSLQVYCISCNLKPEAIMAPQSNSNLDTGGAIQFEVSSPFSHAPRCTLPPPPPPSSYSLYNAMLGLYHMILLVQEHKDGITALVVYVYPLTSKLHVLRSQKIAVFHRLR